MSCGHNQEHHAHPIPCNLVPYSMRCLRCLRCCQPLCPRTHTACARRPRLLGLQFQRILRLQENIMQILCRAVFYHTVLTANPTPFQPILRNSQRHSSISTRQHPTSLKHACTKSKPPTKFFKTQHFAFAVANTAHLQSMPFSMQRPCSTSSPQLPTC